VGKPNKLFLSSNSHSLSPTPFIVQVNRGPVEMVEKEKIQAKKSFGLGQFTIL